MGNLFDVYKGKAVLITGGAGCIGSNLTKALLGLGIGKVVVLDNFSASKEWNVPRDDRVEILVGDVANTHSLKLAFKSKPEYVFHLAAHFANQNSVDHPHDDLKTNGLGTLMVLEQCKANKVERVVYASSGCSVYGSQAPLPLKEDFVSLYLDTPYQIHKLLGELYCNYYYNRYELKIAIARYFNVYGPGEIPGIYRNVIPNFIWQALRQIPLSITGTGRETRDFTYVGDIVDGTLRLGVLSEAVGSAFNLASEKETKIIDVANMVNLICGNECGVRYIPQRDWDKITRRRASIEKAHTVLGYEPKTKLLDGIKNTSQWIVFNSNRIKDGL